MSRAFTPPDTLSKDEIRTIADVRRDIWTEGFRGLALGSVGGWASHYVARFVHHNKKLQHPLLTTMRSWGELNRNTAFFSFMAGGAMGSFLLATTAGKNTIHQLHPIFENNAKSGEKAPVGQGSMYQIMVARAQEEERLVRRRQQEQEERRLQRRTTLTERLSVGSGRTTSSSVAATDHHDNDHWADTRFGTEGNEETT